MIAIIRRWRKRRALKRAAPLIDEIIEAGHWRMLGGDTRFAVTACEMQRLEAAFPLWFADYPLEIFGAHLVVVEREALGPARIA